MFPNNEFFQCPTYFSSNMFFSIVIIIILLIITLGVGTFGADGKIIVIAGGIFGLFMAFWVIRIFYLSFFPNPDCEARGFPGQHFWPWSSPNSVSSTSPVIPTVVQSVTPTGVEQE